MSQWDQMGEYVFNKYVQRFDATYFKERIPFLKEYTVWADPKTKPYSTNSPDQKHRVVMDLHKHADQYHVNTGDKIYKFTNVQSHSEFIFFPQKINEIVHLHFVLKNKVTQVPPDDLLSNRLLYAAMASAQRMSDDNMSCTKTITLHGYNGNIRKKGEELEPNDPDVFPEHELDEVIHEMNKCLFKFEEYTDNMGLR